MKPGNSTLEERSRAIAQNRSFARTEEARARALEANGASAQAACSRELAATFRSNAEYLQRMNRAAADG